MNKNFYKYLLRRSMALCCLCATAFLCACGDDSLLYTEDLTTCDTSQNTDFTECSTTIETTDYSESEESLTIMVHLCGAVEKPGVYEMEQGSRIVDGITKAGGFCESASVDALNLAAPLEDGSKVYIPTIEEVKNYEESCEEYVTVAGACTTSDSDGAKAININTAGESALTTLSGIGETRAKAIIAYREENGPFKKIEDIKNVSGIGDASFEKLKDYITVN